MRLRLSAIPTKNDPRILIESKAYGATGSKQSDVIGDATRIIQQKRQDTTFLLVTDGETWKDREGDLNRLVALQNLGRIARIYTIKMADELEHDLRQLKAEHGVGSEPVSPPTFRPSERDEIPTLDEAMERSPRYVPFAEAIQGEKPQIDIGSAPKAPQYALPAPEDTPPRRRGK